VLARHAREPLQFAHRIRERSLGVGPRLEEALVAGEQEAPLARLQVDDQTLERARRHQDPFGVLRQVQGLLLVPQGDEQDTEGAADEQREQPARDDHPGRQASSRHEAQ
jgi:hypothetical protein